jgi:hypothetical protein
MGETTNRKLAIGGAVTVTVVVVVAVLAIVFLGNAPPSPLFTVTGKQQPTSSGLMTNWNFTFVYNGASTLQNVNIYLNNENTPFKTVPEVTKGWTYEYLWTPSDTSANATITISWQGGTEHYEFQPPATPAPQSPLFTVTGKQQQMIGVGGFHVLSWNFTFAYNGENALQNVNLYLNNGNMPFKTVPEVTKGWTDQYVWTPLDTSANATITISWQSGTEHYEFQP